MLILKINERAFSPEDQLNRILYSTKSWKSSSHLLVFILSQVLLQVFLLILNNLMVITITEKGFF